MNLLFTILAISTLQPESDSLKSSYSYHTQSCHYTWATNYFWLLNFSDSNSFVLSETIQDSRENFVFKNPRDKKNTYKEKGSYMIGTWKKENDTLILKPIIGFNYPQNLLPKVIFFIIGDNNVTQLESNELNHMPNELVFLEKRNIN
jgi:hypothetical protein